MTAPAPAAAERPSAERDPRWVAVAARDASADGAFVYSVRTTGVYCRPSCPSRRANPENVAFHADGAAAEAAGFRPCRRCRPDEVSPAAARAALVARACRVIEAAEEPPALDRLARACGTSAGRLVSAFKAETGLTPKAYAKGERVRRIRRELGDPRSSVASAIYGAGFSSTGRFYAVADDALGMPPSAYRAGGEGAAIRFAVAQCSLGALLVAASARGVCAILLGGDPDALVRDLQDRFPKAELIGGEAGFERVVADVTGLVERPGQGLDLPLDIRGTAFQRRVWEALRKLPAGATASYADVAAAIGAPKAVRAVAQACGANALAVAIPCHRVVRTDGSLSGYRWGVERKRALLARESEQGDAAD
ncbi:bifunctional DNA-binding transcriptional regulator/O6-methylguanine-DNA methyltransferase Ada [Methylopila sp. Yamaguchi]|uniref:bifunctional DNA-binding transcriptional regulator/O6-methylguanine-DNA methyltransferase Ada n=1 Tax=Methylopila sp. Yamaguchi TaxID=1437817 RepID=UPI000CC56736|nr:bifunctional DNA-binding transcriptional regulator/O6-methylguanine-DNA methyltransferase Ada [Methylopila sp. Yamaguchi]GBD50836.1 bifunctional regulatory protein/DNA repair protein [Methylopila sp. Yamaguchi]